MTLEKSPEIFALTGVGIVETDMQSGRFVRVNRAFCEMVGYSEAELWGMTYLELTHPGDRERDAESFAALGQGEVREGASLTRVLHRDGTVVWLELHVTLLDDGDGTTNLTVANDVTERRRAEAALRESRAEISQQACIYETTLSTISDFAYIFNRAGEFIFINQPLLDLWGMTPEEAVGKTFHELPYPKELAATLHRQILQVIETGEPVKDETPYTNPQSETGYYEYIFNPVLGGDGTVESVVGSTHDITERKQHERNLAFLADLEKRFASLTSSEEITKIAGALIGEHFNISHCLLVDVDEQMSVASVFHDHRATAEFPSLVGDYQLENFHSAAEIEQLAAGQPVVINDVLGGRNPPESGVNFDALGTRALLTAPYVRHGRWKFALGAQVNQPRQWRADETEFLTELATRVALRLERARAEEALRENQERQSFLLKLSDALRPLADVIEVQRTAMDHVAERLGVESAVYVEFGPDGDHATIMQGHRSTRIPFPPVVRLSDFGQVFFDDLTAGRNIPYEDAETDPRLEASRGAYRALNIRSGVGVPLIKADRLAAALAVNHTEPRPWPDADLRLLEEVAERTWDAVERAKAEANLSESEEKYRSLFDSIDEGFCTIEVITDENGRAVDFRYLETNPVFERQTGLENAAGKLASEIIPDTESSWLKLYGEVAQTGDALRFENYHEETERWYSAYASRVGGADSRQVCTVFDDITERIRRESNTALLDDISKDLAVLSTPDDIMEAVGARVGEFLRVSSCVFADIDEERDALVIDHAWMTDGVPNLKQAYSLNEYLSEDFIRACREGETYVIRDTKTYEHLENTSKKQVSSFVIAPFHWQGRWTAYFAVTTVEPRDWRTDEIELVREISNRIFSRLERARAEAALRESEAKYRTLFTSMDEGFCIVEVLFDPSGQAFDYRFLEANPAFVKQTGLDDAIGRTMRELAPQHETFWFETYSEIARTGEAVRFEHQAEALNRWYDVYAFRVGSPEERKVAIVFNDIGERRRAEKAFREADERFRTVADTAPVLIWETDADGVMFTNRQYLEFFGVDAEAVRGLGWTRFLHPDDAKGYLAAHAEAFAQRKPYDYECRFRRADGEYRWLFSAGRPLNEHYFVGFFADITENKRVEAALRESEEQLRIAVEAAEMGTWSWHVVTDEVDGSPRHFELFGMTPRDTPLSWADFTRHLHPEDRKWVEERLGQAVDKNGVFEAEFRIVPEEGETRWLSSHAQATALSAEGRTVQMSGVIVDITGRKLVEAALRASEERLRLTVDSIPDYAIFTTDLEGLVTSWNVGAERVFGYPEEEILGRPFEGLFTPEDRRAEVPRKELQAALEQGRAADERWHLRKDGTRFFASGTLAPLRKGGKPTGYAKIARDLTETRIAEQERERLVAELASVNENLEAQVVRRTDALRMSEQRFSQAFYANPIPACMTTFGRETFVEVNDAFVALTGYARDEIVGHTSRELKMWSSPEDLKTLDQMQRDDKGFRNAELELRTEAGEVRDILLSAEVIRLDGHEGYLKMFYDVTDRKRTEEEMHRAIQTVMNDASWFSRSLLEQLARIRTGGNTLPSVDLSKRERQVLERLAGGQSNTVIAEDLGLAAQTVRNYIATIYDKIGAHSRAEAIVWARERSIIWK